jgi:putative transposase
MEAFLRRNRTGKGAGMPRFKKASRWHQIMFPHGSRAVKLTASQTKAIIPGVGSVRLRKGRLVPQRYGRVWIQERNGRWYLSFECERDVTPLPRTGTIRGIDRGISVLVAFDDGTLIQNPGCSERRIARTSRLYRDVEVLTERDARGRIVNWDSPERANAAERLARAREREASARHDYLHKTARTIVESADVVALEKLALRHMTRSAKGTLLSPGKSVSAKRTLNRKMLDCGFGLLRRMIVSKAEEAARTVVEVDPRYSSQTCSLCGNVDSKNRRRTLFRCVMCGHTAHADVEAAIEIRRRAESQLMREPMMPVRNRIRNSRFREALATSTPPPVGRFRVPKGGSLAGDGHL